MSTPEIPPAPVEVIQVEPLVLRENDAAKLLGMAPATLRSWRKLGGDKGPRFRRFGNAVVYDLEELKRFRDAHPMYRSTTEADLAESA